MNRDNTVKLHPVVYAFRNLIGKLTQQPGIYAIKQYKKANRTHKSRNLIIP